MEQKPKIERGIIKHPARIFGHSVLGEKLLVFGPQDAHRLIVAGIHGDEAETTWLLSRALRSIKNSDLSAAVVLSINPDGAALGTRGNANDVDLNRNFPSRDWQPEVGYHKWDGSGKREVALSPGEEPGSEPETQALLQLLIGTNPKNAIMLHSPLEAINDPASTSLGDILLHLKVEASHVSPVGADGWFLLHSVVSYLHLHKQAPSVPRR